MSHTSSIFESQPVSVQNVNGFDLSHIFAGTSKCGQLVVCLRKLLMQASKISVGAAVNVELPPLATSFFGRIDFCIELFFVPCAILYGGWRQFISNQVATMFPSSQDSILESGGYLLPLLEVGYPSESAGTPVPAPLRAHIASLESSNDGLCSYLGVRVDDWSEAGNAVESLKLNMLPFLAYHKIVDVFYRNCSTTKTWFAVNPNVFFDADGVDVELTPAVSLKKNVSLVWHSYYTNKIRSGNPMDAVGDTTFYGIATNVFSTVDSVTFPDNVSLFSTRQRTYERDYFTAGSVTPQQGNPATLSFTVDAQGDGEFTVHALRSIVALQRFEEKLNYDPSYRGVMRNLFGSSPSDALLDEPSYIGRLVLPVYQKSVYVSSGATSSGNSNPYVDIGQVGSKAASGSFSGEGQFCKGYKVGCFGYLMALASLVPHAMYGYGIEREMLANDIGDFPFPDLQTIGMDATRMAEIYADGQEGHWKDAFNYLPRYSWMKYKNDVVAGELRPGKTLESFVLQRVFTQAPEFGTDFVEIAQTDLDGVFSSDVANSKLSCWFEIYWVFKAVMPLAAFCVPTLGELQDVHTIHTTQGGSRL